MRRIANEAAQREVFVHSFPVNSDATTDEAPLLQLRGRGFFQAFGVGETGLQNIAAAEDDGEEVEILVWVYIVTNKRDGVLYIGVTSDLKGRIAKHKSKHYASRFTAKYNLDKLVYYEKIDGIVKAIEREKQLKGGPRRKKIALIEGMNAEWRDLFTDLP